MKTKKKAIKEKTKESPVSLALLLELAEKGMLTLSEILELKKFKKFKENSARTTLWRLRKKGLIKKKEKNFQLTSLGMEMVEALEDGEPVEKEWDGKWRIVMFDIPEKKRQHRNWLRFELCALDYKLLQKSVFMGQQPIDEEIYQKIIERGLDDYIRLLTVGEIDDDEIFEQFTDF